MNPLNFIFAFAFFSLVACKSSEFQEDIAISDFSKELKKELAHYQYIPGGTRSSGLPSNWRTSIPFVSEVRISVPGFFIQDHEVSVGEYMSFYREMKNPAFMPDTLCFMRDFHPYYFNGLYATKYYFSHPKYDTYPIVGITQIQALAYLKWKTEIWQKKLGDRYVVGFRLPTDQELEFLLKSAEETQPVYGEFNTAEAFSEDGRPLKNADDDLFRFTAPVHHSEFKTGKQFNLFGNVAEMTQSTLSDFAFKGIDSAGWINDSCIRQWSIKSENLYRSFQSGHWDSLCLNVEQQALLSDSLTYISKGGSWFHAPYFGQSGSYIPYRIDKAYGWLGFRPVLVLIRKTG